MCKTKNRGTIGSLYVKSDVVKTNQYTYETTDIEIREGRRRGNLLIEVEWRNGIVPQENWIRGELQGPRQATFKRLPGIYL